MNSFVRDFKDNLLKTNRIEDICLCGNIFADKGSNLRIYHNNIRSISKNFEEFEVFLHQLDVKLDIIVFTETWRVNDTSLFNLEGYNVIYNEGQLNQNDGVIVFEFTLFKVYLKSNLKFTHKVITIYQQTALKININLNEKLLRYIDPLFLCPSDYNNGLKTYLQNHCRNSHFNEGFISAINSCTRVQGNSKTCIDQLFFKNIINNPVSAVLHTTITDHFSILFQFDIDQLSEEPETKKQKVIKYDRLKRLIHQNPGEAFMIVMMS
ncbi:hypothetical protein NQ317_004206 [Molorchus minor]|uniref:Uncharacterized protein n=1 Tax=Molorchus minor TaxID=1323400 RepID=A0ABQ9IX68_9CUCU|nr:hypothetical protein NQ317_004206 [Molorchus minor]